MVFKTLRTMSDMAHSILQDLKQIVFVIYMFKLILRRSEGICILMGLSSKRGWNLFMLGVKCPVPCLITKPSGSGAPGVP